MLIDFTPEELNATVQLFDLAVKAGGLQVAEAAVVLTNKLKAAIKVAEDTPTETESK